jgi:hypothetical protein
MPAAPAAAAAAAPSTSASLKTMMSLDSCDPLPTPPIRHGTRTAQSLEDKEAITLVGGCADSITELLRQKGLAY